MFLLDFPRVCFTLHGLIIRLVSDDGAQSNRSTTRSRQLWKQQRQAASRNILDKTICHVRDLWFVGHFQIFHSSVMLWRYATLYWEGPTMPSMASLMIPYVCYWANLSLNTVLLHTERILQSESWWKGKSWERSLFQLLCSKTMIYWAVNEPQGQLYMKLQLDACDNLRRPQ
jgi:hypothetical protein